MIAENPGVGRARGGLEAVAEMVEGQIGREYIERRPLGPLHRGFRGDPVLQPILQEWAVVACPWPRSQNVECACASRSMTSVRSPRSASAAPRFTVVVVLALPPFCVATATIIGTAP